MRCGTKGQFGEKIFFCFFLKIFHGILVLWRKHNNTLSFKGKNGQAGTVCFVDYDLWHMVVG